MTSPDRPVRVGDAERDATIDLLARHFAAGRLTKLEHDERAAAALTATTQPALDALLADLPDLRARDRAPERRAWPAARPSIGLLRLPLVALVALVVAAHAVPVVAVVAAFVVLSRLASGWRCSGPRRSGPHPP